MKLTVTVPDASLDIMTPASAIADQQHAERRRIAAVNALERAKSAMWQAELELADAVAAELIAIDATATAIHATPNPLPPGRRRGVPSTPATPDSCAASPEGDTPVRSFDCRRSLVG